MHHCRHGKESICCKKRCGTCNHRCGDHCGPDIKSTPNECLEDDCVCMLWIEGGKEPPKTKPKVPPKARVPEPASPAAPAAIPKRDPSEHAWAGSPGAWSCEECGARLSCSDSPRPADLSAAGVMADCSMEKVFKGLP